MTPPAPPRTALCLAALALLGGGLMAAPPLGAQRADSLAALARVAPGLRVRVDLRTPKYARRIGAVVRADSLALVLLPQRAAEPVTLDAANILTVEMSRGLRPEGEAFGRGALRGFLVGAGIAVVATGAALWQEQRNPCDGCTMSGPLIVGALGIALTAVTTLAGGAIGLAHRERWERVWPR